MTTLIPENFRQDMITVHGREKATDWLERLPAILESCAQRWGLTILPSVTNLSFHYVAPAVRVDGTQVIVKVDSPTGEFATEAEAIQMLGGPGMARLLEIDYENEVLLLERLMPGTALAELVPEQDERATSILVETMRKIWRPAPAQHNFATVESYGKGFAKLRARYGEDCGPFPRRLVEEAERLFVELNASKEHHLLLHGDLHHDNVLLSGTEWRAIDAKGVVGDPGYETGLLFYNPIPLIKRVPNPRKLLARRVDQLATELGMERERIRGWGLAQCVLSCWWHVEDGYSQPPREELACAEIMAEL